MASIVQKNVTVMNECAEAIMPTLSSNSFDLIHTSPPYFDTELYEQDGPHPQAWRKFLTLDDFKSGFLRVVMLDSGAHPPGAPSSLAKLGALVHNCRVIANSWSTEFGLDELFHIQRGTNECGVENTLAVGLSQLNFIHV